jgi:hypothetical protein
MIRVYFEVGEEVGRTAGFLAAAMRLDGHKDGVNRLQGFCIIEFQDPALLREVVLVEDA